MNSWNLHYGFLSQLHVFSWFSWDFHFQVILGHMEEIWAKVHAAVNQGRVVLLQEVNHDVAQKADCQLISLQHCWCFQKSDIHWSTRHDTVGSWPSIYPHYFALKINPRWLLGISEESTVSGSDDALPKTWTYMNPRSWKKNAQKWQVKDECSKMLGLLEIWGNLYSNFAVSAEMFALKIL